MRFSSPGMSRRITREKSPEAFEQGTSARVLSAESSWSQLPMQDDNLCDYEGYISSSSVRQVIRLLGSWWKVPFSFIHAFQLFSRFI